MRIIRNGTIEQLEKSKPRSRCRKWRLWVTTDEGRRSKRFTGTYTEAQDALEAFKSEVCAQVPDTMELGAYISLWRSWREESGRYAPGTLANDKRNAGMVLRTPLAGMRISDITPADCRDALSCMRSARMRGEGSLSGTTMAKAHSTLHTILQQAVDDGMITYNPMANLKPPKLDTDEKLALSPTEIMDVLSKAELLEMDGRLMAVYLMLCLGLRRGEACALFREDVSDGYMVIRRAVKERNGSVGEPKSKAGFRVLPVPIRLMAKIREWEARIEELGLGAETLCCNTQGGVLRPQNLQRWWSGDSCHNGIRDDLGCHGMTLHQLRHSNLSMMARHMSPFDLQRYAGWSSIEPAKVYIHDDLSRVAAAGDDAWGGA